MKNGMGVVDGAATTSGAAVRESYVRLTGLELNKSKIVDISPTVHLTTMPDAGQRPSWSWDSAMWQYEHVITVS